MTNPDNAVGTNGAYGGRSSVEALNDVLNTFTGRGIIRGWKCLPSSGMTVALGGTTGYRDVAIAVAPSGARTTINNRTTEAINITIAAAPATNSRIDSIVAYVQNPAQGSETVVDNPTACGLIAVSGDVSSSPVAPTESRIRTAITADGGTGSTAYYVVLANITVVAELTTITSTYIAQGAKATLSGDNIANSAITAAKINLTASVQSDWQKMPISSKATVWFRSATSASFAHAASFWGSRIIDTGFSGVRTRGSTIFGNVSIKASDNAIIVDGTLNTSNGNIDVGWQNMYSGSVSTAYSWQALIIEIWP